VKRALQWLDVVVYLVILALAVWFGPRGAVVWYVGLCLSIVAVPPWLAAKRQLGESFSVRPEARQLITGGLYSKFRHPIYVFGTAAFLGAVLALYGWSALVVWVIVVLVQIRRAAREDRILAQAFGPDYAAYRDTTWF
jgi:protein-S-isoprenylcysteine O-methyltransferase Ste14